MRALFPKEPATDTKVSERTGATGERGQGRKWEKVSGECGESGQDGVQVQAQFIQDGVCVQIRALHVPEDSPAQGSPGMGLIFTH